MANILPTRTSADTNSAGDVNDLSQKALNKEDANAKGDLFVATADDTVTRLPVGADGKVLKADSSEPEGVAWDDESGASPLTTKGDLYTYDTGDARLPVGTDGYVLTADSSEAKGIKWAASSGGATKKSGIIKSSSSVANTFSSLQDWQGSGPYTSVITHGMTIDSTYFFELTVKCYQLNGTERTEITPSQIDVIDNTQVRITMPINSDLYVVIIG